MKKFYLSFLFCSLFLSLFAQEDQWAWISGENTIEQPGVYGTKGIASATNRPGGRNAAVKWVDASGNLWLFGGAGHDINGYFGYLNDLWKYDPATNFWTWINGDANTYQKGIYGAKGVAAASNKPGSRYASLSWLDNTGRLWLFGGQGYKETSQTGLMFGLLNDLWMFDPNTNFWTWISGDSAIDQNGVYGSLATPSVANNPGSRQQSISWKDASGNFWLFGGFGRDKSGRFDGALNDLWKYFPSTNQWAWISGDSVIERSGVYGAKGIQAPANKPGSRSSSVGWADASGNLWLFGGLGFPAGNNAGYLNDFWKYNIASNQWAWISGDNIIDQPGVYGIKGTPAAANKPGSRYSSVSWTDASGNLLLFGGVVTPIGSGDVVNDLWSYNPLTNLWAWISGDNTINALGSYGTKGVFAPTNMPGSRFSPVSWSDPSGNLFLFGGSGPSLSSSTNGNYNDLWKYAFKVNTPLPVTFIDFTAVGQNSVALLNWSTSREHSSKYFGIEHSTDGINFDSIGIRTAMGNTNSPTNYQFTHYTPAERSNFYRLKQVDADGQYAYSAVRKVDFAAAGFSYIILQNPVYNNIRLNLHLNKAGKSRFEVRDAAGRLLITQESMFSARSIIHTIPVAHLSKGTYFITVSTGKEILTKGFVIK